ncbi:hypothetical protein BCR39DRAFT_554814 [Naematelia encephala]|uniref:Glycosyl transferase family 1 domain-containing protein n=1 Tax=Naematelia encephala TaxID=71784 RepID=A0A1Y2AE36_9TREE|nr:hypothetical protein BCR39DRAFT_554814 [Naematelia encephala]
MYTVNPLTPPLTPSSPFTSARPSASKLRTRSPRTSALPSTPEESPEFLSLPPPIESVMPDFDLPAAMMSQMESDNGEIKDESERYYWKAGMSPEEKDVREEWISSSRGRRGLRIVIVTENFLPKVDGVTRTLARLLEHLRKEGHECMLLGPTSDRETYAGHPLVGTTGVPLVVYPGLKLNFLRPKFMRTIRDFQPDVVHFVDPIWLGAQTLMAMELGWAGEDWVAEEGPALGAGIAGAVVASYHTNLATYATLFGMSWLEPIMWRLQRWLYSKTLLTLCPSPSTRNMLESQAFSGVRLWPRGVDLTQFGPSKRSVEMRASWGVGTIHTDVGAVHTGASWGVSSAEEGKQVDAGVHYQGRRASMPLTPPASPWVAATEPVSSIPPTLPERVVLLYVGRISWEKNLHLLLAAYANLPTYLPTGAVPPKLVFVGDGPARTELEGICAKSGYDAIFMGHRSGEELATCYASGDVFAFPSFTETFGQVVLEALASGLPIIGLDAEGTRDLVQHQQTGFLLPLPTTTSSWSIACQPSSSHFKLASQGYAQLLARAVMNREERHMMGLKASTDGVRGFTWWDAMESCVDGYRESIRISREKRRVKVVCHSSTSTSQSNTDIESTFITPSSSSSPKISRVNRVVSRRLAKRRWELNDTCETLWHLKNVLKAFVVIWMFWAIYSHHQYSKSRGVEI